MQALTIAKNENSIADVKVSQVEIPKISDNEVLIKVCAVGLNPVDYKLIENHPDGWNDPHVLGLDAAGIVEKVGDNCDQKFSKGQRVFFHGDLAKDGVFAEYAKAKSNVLAKIPDNVSFEAAAAILCSGLTAYASLFRKMNLTGKKTVLIHAGAGGVGSIAVQLAKYLGLTVFTTVSTKKIEFAKKIGADYVIDYKKEDTTAVIQKLTHGVGVDLIINLVGGIEVQKDLERLTYNGAVVDILNTPDLTNYDLGAKGQSVLSVNLGGAHHGGNKGQLNDLATMANSLVKLVSQGVIDPLITKEIKFAQIPSGLRLIKEHQTEGKIVAIL
ncbi:zinc-binding dehydrogenase [Companilactobacillus sp. HBUAS56257]|uniref:zinc-binding dehydrogenase n=1 Tax=Companilactobacillus sp. HBUAS56257 TaxID=3109360 RepID=UPI002FF30FD7